MDQRSMSCMFYTTLLVAASIDIGNWENYKFQRIGNSFHSTSLAFCLLICPNTVIKIEWFGHTDLIFGDDSATFNWLDSKRVCELNSAILPPETATPQVLPLLGPLALKLGKITKVNLHVWSSTCNDTTNTQCGGWGFSKDVAASRQYVPSRDSTRKDTSYIILCRKGEEGVRASNSILCVQINTKVLQCVDLHYFMTHSP